MRILYLQHVDWEWIPQRPHFLAVELTKLGHDVSVRYLKAWRRSGHVSLGKDLPMRFPPQAVRGVPQWHRPFWRYLDGALLARSRRALSREAWDIIWVTHPRLFPLIPEVASARVVYDCMDMATEMAGQDSEYVGHLEQGLIRRASLVLASSPRLVASIPTLSTMDAPPMLVRNACRGDLPWPALSLQAPSRAASPVRVLFFGTIGPWLDFHLLEALAEAENVQLRMIGPVRGQVPPALSNCIERALPHRELFDVATSWADWLILPFRRDRFTETIDPVKLYEYVGLARPILAPPLDVLQPAAAFLVSYTTIDEALTHLHVAPVDDASRRRDRKAFVESNTWAVRAAEVNAHIAGTWHSAPTGP